MKIAIVGAGAVGGYYGARLDAAGHEVTFLARNPTARILATRGLRLESTRGDLTLPSPRVATSGDAVGHQDLVVIAVKSAATPEAVRLAAPMVGPATFVLTLQNGIENPDLIAGAFGTSRTLPGACRIEVDAPEPGRIVHKSPFDSVAFGPLPGGDDPAPVKDAFQSADVRTKVEADGRVAVWTKAAMLVPMSALTALTGGPVGPVFARAEGAAVFEALSEEVASVGRAAGVPLPADMASKSASLAASVPPTMTSSLQNDLSRGRPSEVEGLQGAVLRAAGRFGVPVPRLTALTLCLRVLDARGAPESGRP